MLKPERIWEICKDLSMSFDTYLSKKVFKEESTGWERLQKAIKEADRQANEAKK